MALEWSTPPHTPAACRFCGKAVETWVEEHHFGGVVRFGMHKDCLPKALLIWWYGVLSPTCYCLAYLQLGEQKWGYQLVEVGFDRHGERTNKAYAYFSAGDPPSGKTVTVSLADLWPLADLYSSRVAGEMTGRAMSTIQHLHRRHGIGTKRGRDIWLTAEDIARILTINPNGGRGRQDRPDVALDIRWKVRAE